MLKGISPLISPELLKLLSEMGHGDEIVFTDAYYPAHTCGRDGAVMLRADGIPCARLLAAVERVFPLDTYELPVVMMAPVAGDSLDPTVERDYRKSLKYDGEISFIDRDEFYERSKHAYAIVLTGETRTYGNVLLKKGLPPPYEV